ncbi:MAG: triose-phosphate isomerase [Planctomycetota bacterium]
MSRIPFIAGNWKMNLTGREAIRLATDILRDAGDVEGVDVALCPAFVHLADVADVVRDTRVGLGAQNLYRAGGGAFTGEISGAMLKDIGCRYVILGHSERRQFCGETDAEVNRKLHEALTCGLLPIVCVGETRAEREKNETAAVVTRQVNGAFAKISAEAMETMTIAYEPVWAIGTGLVATPEQAQEVHKLIRSLVEKLYGRAVAGDIRIQYGGSVKPDNVEGLMKQADIDGALVGGAALAAASFVPLVKKAAEARKG